MSLYAQAGLVVIDANNNVQEYSSNKQQMQPRSGPPDAPQIISSQSSSPVRQVPAMAPSVKMEVKKQSTKPSGYVIDATTPAQQQSITADSGAVVTTMAVKTPQPRPVTVEQATEEENVPVNPSNWRLNSARLANDFGFGVLTYEQLMEMPTLEGGPREWRYIPKTNVIFNINWFSRTQ